METTKLYTIYYLPNCKRQGYINSKGEPQVGKVGCTGNKIEHRIRQNLKTFEYDISNWQILEQKEMTKEEARAIEYQYQLEYDCLDHYRQPSVISSIIGKKSSFFQHSHSEETKKKLSEIAKNITSEQREKMSLARIGKRYYTDNIKNILVDPGTEPIGFKPGKKKKNKILS